MLIPSLILLTVHVLPTFTLQCTGKSFDRIQIPTSFSKISLESIKSFIPEFCELSISLDSKELHDNMNVLQKHGCKKLQLLPEKYVHCFASAVIDYGANTVQITITPIATLMQVTDPYDDLLVSYNNEKSDVVQYKIDYDTDADDLRIIARVECYSIDDCALQKLRKVVAELLDVNKQLSTLKELKEYLDQTRDSNEKNLT